jgi:predicted small lipoprotein YifL
VSSLLRFSAAACLLLAVGGCGQKGALYLPDAKPQAVGTTPAASAADEAARRKAQHPSDPATTP